MKYEDSADERLQDGGRHYRKSFDVVVFPPAKSPLPVVAVVHSGTIVNLGVSVGPQFTEDYRKAAKNKTTGREQIGDGRRC